MKRIELILDNFALDIFRESASELGIEEFELSEVHRSSTANMKRQRLYRGMEYSVDLPTRTKVEFAVDDCDVDRIAQAVVACVRPEAMSVFAVQQIILTERRLDGGKLLHLDREGRPSGLSGNQHTAR